MLTWAKLDLALKNRILCRFMKRSTTAFSLPVLQSYRTQRGFSAKTPCAPGACGLCVPGVENPGPPGTPSFRALGRKNGRT